MAYDIDFSFKPNPLTGDLSTKNSRTTAIRQSIINLVRTNYYNRGFNVEVGTNVDASLFENATNLTAVQLKQNIMNCLENFEPRVIAQDVEVYNFDDNTLRVNIVYKELNQADVLNLPLDLSIVR